MDRDTKTQGAIATLNTGAVWHPTADRAVLRRVPADIAPLRCAAAEPTFIQTRRRRLLSRLMKPVSESRRQAPLRRRAPVRKCCSRWWATSNTSRRSSPRPITRTPWERSWLGTDGGAVQHLPHGAALSIHYRGGVSRGTTCSGRSTVPRATCNSPPRAARPRSSR